MAQIIWTDPARDDLAEVYEYIALDNPDAAERVVARILRHVKQLEKHPKSGLVPNIASSSSRLAVFSAKLKRTKSYCSRNAFRASVAAEPP